MSDSIPSPSAPQALLVIAAGCPHCPTVLAGLADLIKQGAIGRLEVINASTRPDDAAALGVRSVPWLRLGPFELEGLRSMAELKRWAERAGSPQGMIDYLNELLGSGQLAKVLPLIQRDPALLGLFPQMLADSDTELPVRVGIGAIFEDFAGTPVLAKLAPALIALAGHSEARMRADAAHFLALTRTPDALPVLRKLLKDDDADVRDIAAESLAVLEGGAA